MFAGIITSLIAFLAYGGLLIPVLQKGLKGDQPSRIFSIYLLDMMLLQVAYFGLSVAQNEQQALLWITLNIPISSAQVIIYFFFIRKLLDLKITRNLILGSIFMWVFLIGISTIFRSEVIPYVYRDQTNNLFVPEIGFLASVLSIPIIVFLGITASDLARFYREKSRGQQTRVQYLFLAIIIVWIGMASNISPALRPYAIDVSANILSAFIIAYAILRHQLLEFNTALRKILESFISLLVIGLGSTIIIFFFIRFVHVQVGTYIILLAAIISTVTLLVLIPLRDQLQRYVRRFLFKTTYDSYLMVQRLSRTATSILDLKKLSGMILKDVVYTMNASWGILLIKKNVDYFQLVAQERIDDNPFAFLNGNFLFINWLHQSEEDNTIYSLRAAVEQNILSEQELSSQNLTGNEIIIPLKVREQLIGILGLGPRLRHGSYSQDIRQALLIVANNLASTIENARLYESVQEELKERIQAEAALQENEAIFSSFLEHSQVYVFFKDKNIRSIRLSKNYEKMLGMPISEILGKTMDELFPSDLAKSMVEDDKRILNNGQVVYVVEELNGRTYETTKFPIFIDGKPEMLAGVTLDITERKQADERLKDANKLLGKQLGEIKALQASLNEQVIRDPLTGLYNRRYLYETTEHELARAIRKNYPISIMMIDIDHFKSLNDTYGHQAGDEIIIALSKLLQENIRQGDIACRYGGDEFTLVLPGVNIKDAKQRAETIRQNIKKSSIIYGGVNIFAAVSIGVAVYPHHGSSMDEIINASDKALYDAKQAGRNQVHIWKRIH